MLKIQPLERKGEHQALYYIYNLNLVCMYMFNILMLRLKYIQISVMVADRPEVGLQMTIFKIQSLQRFKIFTINMSIS